MGSSPVAVLEIIDEIERIKEEKKVDKVKWFTKDVIKPMILENLKQCVFSNEIRNNIINMYMANDEQNHLAKYIKEFKTKTKPKNNSNLKKSKRGCN